MLENVLPVQDLQGLARRKKLKDVFKSVRHALVEEEINQGWAIAKKNKSSTRLSKPKPPHVLLEDRVWTFLHRLGFSYMSGDGGAQLVLDPKNPDSPKNQIDVIAIDAEVALAISCKSCITLQKKPRFKEELAEHVSLRENFAKAVRGNFGEAHKRHVVFAMFTSNILLTENDRARVEEAKVALFEESDLTYYELLVSHLGPATRYQFLADILAGKSIAGLEITVPAVRSKMGGYYCYTFSISPEYLLKVAHVSRRAKGKATDVDAYQRMIKKSRLRAIQEYISDDGIFPTNIVVNVPGNYLQFERAKQEGDETGAIFGWLRLRPAYKVAWIIDGQHRLFAYSGHPRAAKSVVSVLAFSGLPESQQARLFVDINAEQRKVSKSLLHELYAELNWDADDPEVRASAIVSKAILSLDQDPDSPFCGRILKADEQRTSTRCISLTSIFGELEKTGFYISGKKKGEVIEFGPLWAVENIATMKRTIAVLNGWFSLIRDRAATTWNLGADEGGGLAMNDGVSICINVLRGILQHLESKGQKLSQLDDTELVERITPYGQALGDYFSNMDAQQMKGFRSLRGIQGQTTGMRKCQEALRKKFPEFNPTGLSDYLEAEAAQTTEKAIHIVLSIEKTLQAYILDELRSEFGENESDWWFSGVPKSVRKKVDDRINEEGGKKGGREANFDLLDYRDIIIENWQLFGETFGFGTKGNKDVKTKWIEQINEIRKVAVHASKGTHLPVTREQVAFLEELESWVKAQVSSAG